MVRVLLADDEEFVRYFLRTVLEELSYNVVGEVEKGDELLSAMESQKPDILLLDVNMPKLTGIEFLQKHAHEFPDTCIIILTSATSSLLMNEASEVGAKCFLRKDTSVTNMMDAIEKTWSEFKRGQH